MSIKINYSEPVALDADAPLWLTHLDGHREHLTFGDLASRFDLESNSDLRFAIAFRQYDRMILATDHGALLVHPA